MDEWEEYRNKWLDKTVELWWDNQMKDIYAMQHLYYRKFGGGITVSDKDPGEGWILASPQRLSPAWERSRCKHFIHDTLCSLPVLGENEDE